MRTTQTSTLIGWFFLLTLWLDQGLTGCHVKWTLAIIFFSGNNALDRSMFWLRKSKYYFWPLFHADRPGHAYWFSAAIIWSAWFAFSCKSIFFDLFWNVNFFITVRVVWFSPKCPLELNNYKRFAFFRECDGFLPVSCNLFPRWAQHVNVFSRMLNSHGDSDLPVYKSKVWIIKEWVVTQSQWSLSNDFLKELCHEVRQN